MFGIIFQKRNKNGNIWKKSIPLDEWTDPIFILSRAYFTKVISNFPKLACPKIGYPLWSTPTVLTPFRGQGGSSREKKNLKSR